MRRDSALLVAVWGASLLLCAALVQQYVSRRPPYFRWPRTVMDHVEPGEHHTRATLLLLPEVAPLLPPGAQVTVFRPRQGRAWNDHDIYLTAVGLLPNQWVLPPFTAVSEKPEEVVEWVVAVGEPLRHPAYEVVAGFPNGYLYRKRS